MWCNRIKIYVEGDNLFGVFKGREMLSNLSEASRQIFRRHFDASTVDVPQSGVHVQHRHCVV